MKRLILSLAVIAALFGFTAGAEAASTSTTLSVSATAIPTCTVSTTAVSFGNVDGLTIVSANGNVSVNCSSGVPYNIAMDAGLGYSTISGWRTIMNGINSRSYSLFKEIALTSLWGDSDYANTYPWGSSLADTGSGSAQAHTVYGRLWGAGGALPAGAYSDTVTVTVYY